MPKNQSDQVSRLRQRANIGCGGVQRGSPDIKASSRTGERRLQPRPLGEGATCQISQSIPHGVIKGSSGFEDVLRRTAT